MIGPAARGSAEMIVPATGRAAPFKAAQAVTGARFDVVVATGCALAEAQPTSSPAANKGANLI